MPIGPRSTIVFVVHARLLAGRILLVFLSLCTAAQGQHLVPLADPVEQDLLPPGIFRLDVHLNAPLAYVFQDDDGSDAMHFLGGFTMTVGEGEAQEFYSREAMVWITNREEQGQAYQHLDILLWGDAEIYEVAGTLTTAPSLFVTMNTLGTMHAGLDDVAFQPSKENEAYTQGSMIRAAVAAGAVADLQGRPVYRVFNAAGLGRKPVEAPKPLSLIQVRSEGELTMARTDAAGQVLMVNGGVYLSRGVPGSGEHLEIRADSVVVFLPDRKATKPQEKKERPAAGLGGEIGRPPRSPKGQREQGHRGERRREAKRQRMSAGFGEFDVEGAYLEGDVVMTQGANMIRASRIYYDFLEDRAIILDAVVRTALAERNLPLYLRAAEIRQLSRGHFTATDAVLTTSEFHTPHYHIGARRVEISGLTPAGPAGAKGGLRAGRFDVRQATLNVGGRPILYWPHVRGNLDTSETSIRSVRTGFSDLFGLEFETDWSLFHVLGLETPEGFDGNLSLDYFSRRGPAIGIDATYQRDRYFGLLRSYLLSDKGEDFLGRNRETLSQREVRGRFLLRHRQYLEEDWQLSLELSYISDRGFLEEFFESEFDNDKEQETLIYLKKQRDNWAFTSLLQTRILDFMTQIERSPDFAYHQIGEPIGDRFTWFSENRLGYVRRRPADQTFPDFLREGRTVGSGSVGRADTRQEIGMPVDLGPFRFVPFASVRGTVWDDSPHDGGLARVFGTLGVRGSMYFSRTFPGVHSALFDLDGVRHIIKPDLVAWVSHTNRDSSELFIFDDTVEDIDEVDGLTLGLRQRWQTRRGLGDNRRSVDFLSLDTEVGFFSDADPRDRTNGFTSFSRPENSVSRNYANASIIWRANDRTALLSEVNYDVNDGDVDILNLSMAVERPPRMSYLLGYRFINEENSNLLGFDMNYRLTEKHSLALRELFDLARGQTLDFTIALVRKFPRWFGAVSFALDEAEDDFGISFSLWPEGMPKATLGSRRFSGIANITRLRRK